MPIYRLGDATPQIDPSAWVADNATLIGHVTLGPGASVWYGAVLRGDNEPIVIGARSNVQENAVLHTDPGRPLTVGEDVTIGHQVMLHGCSIGDGSLIGIQAVLLNGAVIGRGSLVGAGALVTEDKVFADGALIVGSPAAVKRQLSAEQIEGLKRIADGYVTRAQRYRRELARIA
jgi:carbonic anhydrase/acetyltransferase-like protein (isoleucine patch superfamily)